MGLLDIGRKAAGKLNAGKEIVYDADKCVLCRRCVSACKLRAVSLDAMTRTWTRDTEKCIGCGSCVKKCPAGALRWE